MMFFFRPFVAFVGNPAWALVPALGSLAVGLIGLRVAKYKRGIVRPIVFAGLLTAPILWLIYAAWEFSLTITYPPGDPQIRVDLFFIAPVLCSVSLVQLITLCWILAPLRQV
jgi:hypothetical protein